MNAQRIGFSIIVAVVLATSGCLRQYYYERNEMLNINYANDISRRDGYLKTIAYTDSPGVEYYICTILRQAGVLGLRDYLICLAELAPTRKA